MDEKIMRDLIMDIFIGVVGILLTIVTIFREVREGKEGRNQTIFENNRTPLNYTFSIGQPLLEKLVIPGTYIDTLIKPEIIINLERKEGGLAKQVFLAEYRDKLRIIAIENEPWDRFNYDHAYFTSGSNLNLSRISISFSPTDLLLMNRDNLALAKFVVLQGLDNRFQVITFIKFIGVNEHETEDALVYFDGLEVYSESAWETKITAHGWNQQTMQKLFSIYGKTCHEYSGLCEFIQKNIVA